MMRTLLFAPLLFLFTATSAPAVAGEAEAERYRLQQELESLARRNAWTGVERTYVELQKLQLPLTLADHLLGAQSAIQLGDMLAALTRLQVGLAVAEPNDDPNSPYATAKALKANFEERYGQVQIQLGDCGPILFMPNKPFAEQERQAYTQARTRLMEGGSFTGLLPAGDYRVDTFPFTVAPGQAMTLVKAEGCKLK
jgi:hypothetical protein